MIFEAFAAVVIGGVSLKGGVGSLPGVFAGVLLLTSIRTAINLLANAAAIHPDDPRGTGSRANDAGFVQTSYSSTIFVMKISRF
jgi:hypothetical protein